MSWRGFLVALGLMVGSFLFGYYRAKSSIAPEVVERIVTEEGKERVVWKDKVIIVEKEKETRPDGTVIEKERTTEKDKASEKETASKQTKQEKDVKPQTTRAPKTMDPSTYSVSVRLLSFSEYEKLSSYEATIGRKLIGPLWAEASFSGRDNAISAGLRVEF